MIEIDLSGQTAVVTGAGRGIGREISNRFAAAGANVVVAARTEEEIRDTAEHIESYHRVESLAVRTDLVDVGDIHDLVNAATERFGVPEILVNNAGANLAGPALEMSTEDVDTMAYVNLRATFLLTQYWARRFRNADIASGRVINISSGTAHIGVPRMTFYGGTNTGINGLTRGWAAELAPDEVTVNSVTPGLIRIDRIEHLLDEQGENIYDLNRVPLGRLGYPEDVANACLFYASELADYVTGTELKIDGGVTFTAGLYK